MRRHGGLLRSSFVPLIIRCYFALLNEPRYARQLAEKFNVDIERVKFCLKILNAQGIVEFEENRRAKLWKAKNVLEWRIKV